MGSSVGLRMCVGVGSYMMVSAGVFIMAAVKLGVVGGFLIVTNIGCVVGVYVSSTWVSTSAPH